MMACRPFVLLCFCCGLERVQEMSALKQKLAGGTVEKSKGIEKLRRLEEKVLSYHTKAQYCCTRIQPRHRCCLRTCGGQLLVCFESGQSF